MSFRVDDRAAAVQVGAIVLFAFVVIAITAYQASVVPAQNKEIEFNHNEDVQGQLQELQGTVGSMPAVRERRTVTVDLSTSYPARTIFINPPKPNGRLQTVGTRDEAVALEVRNASATNDDVGDFWDGRSHNYSTGALVFRPNYNVYGEAPTTVVENSLVYNRFSDSTDLSVNSQSMFDGNEITLVAVKGSFREQTGTRSVDVRPVSASTKTITVEQTGSDNVTVSIVSQLSAKQWRTILQEEGEFYNQSSGGHVAAVRENGTVALPNGMQANVVEFKMELDETYTLQLARVGVGKLRAGERTTNASVAVAITERATTDEDVNETITVEVRDQYNNPKSGVSVNATATGSANGNVVESELTTNEDGRVTFTYNTPTDISGSSKEQDEVRVSFTGDPTSGFDESAPENVTSIVTVKNTDGSGTRNGAGNYELRWDLTYIGNQNTYAQCYGANETCVYNISKTTSDSLDMRVNTTPVTSEVFVDFGHNNSTIVKGYNPSEGVTDSAGYRTTTLSFENGDPQGEVRLLASTVEDSEKFTLKVVGVGGSGSSTSADQVSLAGSTARGNKGQTVDFTLQNSGSTSVEITDIEVNSVSNSAERVHNKQGAELMGSNGGSLDQTISIDGTTYRLDSNAPISASSSSTITLTDFQKLKGNGKYEDADMNGETVVVTVYYADGSSEEFTLNL